MLVTSLSVPGAHLKCDVPIGSTHEQKLLHAWAVNSYFLFFVDVYPYIDSNEKSLFAK